MSFFSSAGPATVRRPTPSSSRTICASVVFPSPGGPASEHVVERLFPLLGGVERDPQLLLDALLPDEVLEPARPERPLDLLVLRTQSAARGTGSCCGPAQRDPHPLLGGQLGIDLGQRALGVDERVAELDERVTGDEMAGRVRDGCERRLERRAELLLELQHDAFRRLLADPGDRLEARVVAERDRLSSSPEGDPETTASATFGPIPLTVRRCTKSSRSSASANP